MTVLEGPHLRLRPPTPDDYSAIFAWYNDPEIVAPFDRFSTDTYDGMVRSIESAPADPTSLAPRFTVEQREDRAVIGIVGHYRAHPVLEYTEVWYILGERSARGRGFGREAVGLLVGHLFATGAEQRVGAVCDVANVPSVRLLEGLGLRREGTLQRALFHHGAWHDVHVYGITAAEWAQRPPPG
jgi:RimJ/RimL family protein N-acetyltransferase